MTNGDFAVYCARIAQRASTYCSDSLNLDLRDRKVEHAAAKRFLKDMHEYLDWADHQLDRGDA